MRQGLQDLSSRTSDWTQAMAVEMLSPNHWTSREFPELAFKSVPLGISLVVQWLGLRHFHCQGPGFDPWSRN